MDNIGYVGGREKVDKLVFFKISPFGVNIFYIFVHFCSWKQNESSTGDVRVHLLGMFILIY